MRYHKNNNRPPKIQVLPKNSKKIQLKPDWKIITQIISTFCGAVAGFIIAKSSGIVLGALFGLLLGKACGFFFKKNQSQPKKNRSSQRKKY